MKTELILDHTEIAKAVAQEVVLAIRHLFPKGKMEEEPIFTVETLAKYIRVNATWVYKHISLRKISFFKV
jgi:hypothetical protein